MENIYLRLNEVIKNYKISRATVYRLISENKFPQQKRIGGSVFWRKEEIDYLLEHGELLKIKK